MLASNANVSLARNTNTTGDNESPTSNVFVSVYRVTSSGTHWFRAPTNRPSAAFLHRHTNCGRSVLPVHRVRLERCRSASHTDSYATSVVLTRTLSGRPFAPIVFASVADGPSSSTVMWQDRSANEDGFRVSGWTGSAWTVVGSTGAGATSFVDPTPVGGWSAYMDSAFNSGGQSDSKPLLSGPILATYSPGWITGARFECPGQ